MSDAANPRPRSPLRTGRMEAFSDGVFAVAITLLVLEISVPLGSEDALLGAVFDQWPSYLAYVVSFATVGAIWLAHTAVTYGLTLLAASAVLSAMWRYAVHRHLVRPDAGDEEVAVITRKLTPGLAFYAVVVGLGLFLPVVAVLGYLAIALFYLVPIRSLRRPAAQG
jgi:uncharacterized membrane protein